MNQHDQKEKKMLDIASESICLLDMFGSTKGGPGQEVIEQGDKDTKL